MVVLGILKSQTLVIYQQYPSICVQIKQEHELGQREPGGAQAERVCRRPESGPQ